MQKEQNHRKLKNKNKLKTRTQLFLTFKPKTWIIFKLIKYQQNCSDIGFRIKFQVAKPYRTSKSTHKQRRYGPQT